MTKMSQRQMLQMRLNGATYQEIADASELSKQRVYQLLTTYTPELKGMRGNGFNIETIVYKGIYEHFKKNKAESLTSFAMKVFGYTNNDNIPSMRKFLLGEYNSRYTIPQMQKICEVVGMPFEKVFERRCKR